MKPLPLSRMVQLQLVQVEVMASGQETALVAAIVAVAASVEMKKQEKMEAMD
ncbi:MAG: hypothetical protein VKK04_15705 [Synechococcales bacterium]|nr:hypothetical protein [Synechococcales bacterium]